MGDIKSLDSVWGFLSQLKFSSSSLNGLTLI